MNVIRARTAGFCMGVSLALYRLNKALDAWKAQRCSGRLVTLGPIIHNPRVIADYTAAGILCLKDVDAVQPADIVLVRAHGVARTVEKRLFHSGAHIIDATCPKVKKAQTAIQAAWDTAGGVLLLFGEAEHPEVKGLVSYTSGETLVFGTVEEAADLELTPGMSYFLAAQTTQDQEMFARIHTRLAERLGGKLPVLHTICDATKKRQDEVITLARNVDGMVVVGGGNSGNTRRLVEIAEGQNVPVVLIESVDKLPMDEIRTWKTVGLTAGASTPATHIDAVQKALESL